MEDLEKLFTAIGTIVLVVGSLVARFQGTDKNKPFLGRLAMVFDVTQILDPTRKLND